MGCWNFPPVKPPLKVVPTPMEREYAAAVLVEDCGVRVEGDPPVFVVPYPKVCCGQRFYEAVKALGLEGMKFEYRGFD